MRKGNAFNGDNNNQVDGVEEENVEEEVLLPAAILSHAGVGADSVDAGAFDA